MKRLIWYSGTKKPELTTVEISTIKNIWVGTQDPTLMKNVMPMLAHISFTLDYLLQGKEKRLHLTCKDELEFDLWVCGIKALHFHFKGLPLSKMELLSHSRQFNYYIENKEIAQSTKAFFEEAGVAPKGILGGKTLEDYVVRKVRSKEELKALCDSIHAKLLKQQGMVEEATERLDVAPEAKEETGYRILTAKESEADDKTQIKTRMNELFEQCMKNHFDVSNELDALPDENGGAEKDYETKLKKIDAKLWKIDIDIENINDMIRRIEMQGDLTVKEKMKNWFPKIF